uniref:Reverse transcriptase domain-containing protein n=1 Tax=Tanacetum cinerariifolium TaxID=118510 RepID=A0A6L2KT39_TANCI|nr:reverse transcriptase domain-containing protein [Tanacetum cinerariifolium]
MMFSLSLIGESKTWLDELNEGTIETWDELRTAFISQLFPPALFDRLLEEIRAFSQLENELRMKEMILNCHGHNLSKGNIIKIFYHGLSEITQEVLNTAAGGIFLYKTPNKPYQLLKDKVLLKVDWAKNKKTESSIKKTIAFASEGSSNFDTDKIMARMDAKTLKMDARLADKQSSRPSGSLPSNTQPNLKGHNSKAYQPPQACNEHVNVVFTRSDTCFSIDVIDEILEEDFDSLLDEGSKILHSIEGTILEEENFSEFDEFMGMTAVEYSDPESDTEELTFEKITINTNYKIKTSLEEPPTDLELKPLPDNLEYVFLEEPSFLPVIISSQLSKEKKNKLVSIFKKQSKPLYGK